jgi:hypothetical protein
LGSSRSTSTATFRIEGFFDALHSRRRAARIHDADSERRQERDDGPTPGADRTVLYLFGAEYDSDRGFAINVMLLTPAAWSGPLPE